MTFPLAPVPIPDIVAAFAAGRPAHAVWVNELGGVTFRIGDQASAADSYVKTGPGRFADEAARLRWASRYVPVPAVLGLGPDWLHTAALPGTTAVHPRFANNPAAAARAIGVGLRVLHDSLPVADCPFDWSVSTRLSGIVPAARTELDNPPPLDRPVVCHGDACAPNTLLDDAGNYCGHVDLDALGVADRWADLAVATMSLDWNYPGEGWQAALLGAYGIEPDALRLDYYRRLWNAPERTPG